MEKYELNLMIIQAVLHFNVYIIVSPLPPPTRPTPLNKESIISQAN